MNTKIQLLILFMILTLPFLASLSRAETVTTKTVTQEAVPPGSRPINLTDFDINHDGILSGDEVGDMVYRLFDTDNNNVIDKKEYEAKAILTVIPMKKETTISYDINNTGIPDKVQTTSETFMQKTQL